MRKEQIIGKPKKGLIMCFLASVKKRRMKLKNETIMTNYCENLISLQYSPISNLKHEKKCHNFVIFQFNNVFIFIPNYIFDIPVQSSQNAERSKNINIYLFLEHPSESFLYIIRIA